MLKQPSGEGKFRWTDNANENPSKPTSSQVKDRFFWNVASLAKALAQLTNEGVRFLRMRDK